MKIKNDEKRFTMHMNVDSYDIAMAFIIFLFFAGIVALVHYTNVYNSPDVKLSRFNERYELCIAQERTEEYCLVFAKDE